MSKMRLITTLFILVGLVFGSAPRASAQAPAAGTPATPPAAAKKEQPEEKVKTGVIASYGSYGKNAKIDAATTPSPGEEASAISGSVSRVGSGRCQATVKNNSKENSYSVSFAVVEVTASGGTGASRGFIATIKPQASTTRDVPCDNNRNMQVVLRSAKKL